MVNVSHVNKAFTVAASPFFRYFSQSVRRSVVIVCFPPIGICFSFLIKLSEYNPDLEWCETTFISVVFDVLSASHVHDAPRKVPRIFSFSKTLPSFVHFPPMKEPCIWEIYTLSLQCWAFFFFTQTHLLKETTCNTDWMFRISGSVQNNLGLLHNSTVSMCFIEEVDTKTQSSPLEASLFSYLCQSFPVNASKVESILKKDMSEST